MSLENYSRVKALVEEWRGKEGYRVPAEVITEMFNIHNVIFWERPEHSRGCAGCRERVWNKLKAWYEGAKSQYEQ